MAMPWQSRALSYYDKVGELRYASHFYARQLSRVRYYPAMLQPDGSTKPIENGPPVEILNQVQDPSGGRSRLQYDYGRLMFVTGEGSLFVTGADPQRWRFLWREEVKVRSDGSAVRVSLSGRETSETGTSYRLWTPHPRHSDEADSPLRPVLDIAEELMILTASVRATATSRMTNGMLLLSSELSPAPSDPGLDDDPENNPFMKGLTKHLQNQIENPGSAAARVPYVLEGAFDYIREGVKWIQMHDPQTDYMERDLRIEAVKRMALGMDMPPEVLLGMTDANHWPCDSSTEVFTLDRGFVTHDELAAGDVVLSLNHATGQSEWVPLSGVRREHVEDKEMVRIQSPSVDALTTPDHRWPVLRKGERVWTTSGELRADDRIVRAAPHSDPLLRPVYDDAFVETVAWFLSEGTCTWPSPKHCQVRICQSHKKNPHLVARIRETLTRTYGEGRESLWERPNVALKEAAWREDAEPRGMTIFHLNKVAYDPILSVVEGKTKIVKREFILSLTQEQLELFLTTFALGDGNLRENGGFAVNQRDPARLEPLALAAILLGRAVGYTAQKRTGGFSDGIQHYLRVPFGRKDAAVNETSRERYTGIIFCPQVPPTCSFLARRNGKVYFTGNTAQQVQHDMWRSHGIAVAERLADDLAEVVLRPALREANFSNWQNVVVDYDDSQVVISPDRTTVANDALDRLAISFEGYRELAGIREDMAPTEAEKMFLAALKIRNPAALGEGAAPLTTPARGPVPEPGQNGNAADGPPPPTRGRPVSRQEARTAAIMGAAALALRQCRAKAGARLRQHARHRCDECNEKIDGKPNSVVASLLGMEQLEELAQHNPLALVKGGTDEFRGMLAEWNIAPPDVESLCERIEVFAGNTLFEPVQPDLPPGFQAQVELAQEIPLEIG